MKQQLKNAAWKRVADLTDAFGDSSVRMVTKFTSQHIAMSLQTREMFKISK